MITLEERTASRLAIFRLSSLLESIEASLERGAPLTEEVEFLLGQITQSDARDTQHNKISAWLDETRDIYRARLRQAAPGSLSCFAEYMNPDEPPAHHHEFMCDKLELLAARVIMRMLLSMPPGHAKDLALSTPIPTPTGWSTIGDLKVGDKVFDENGVVCSVIRKTPVFKNMESYTVTTDCEDSIIAGKGHEWLVRLCGKREVYHVKTTEYLGNRKASKRPQIKHAGALQLPDADLPVDPYVLGYWLGDGDTAGIRFTIGHLDQPWVISAFSKLGYTLRQSESASTHFGLCGIRHHFTALGLLGNKHIPTLYLRSSVQQRKALLQGIVDSDGHVMPTGQIEISSVKKDLAEGYQELVRSLGVKCSIIERTAVCYNAAGGVPKDCGPHWTVSFYMQGAARMPRKAKLTRDNGRTPGVYIDVTPTEPTDTMCIEVDSPSHLFLAGRSMTPTHNSTYATHLFPAWYLGNHPRHKYIQAGHTQDFVDEEFGKRVRGIISSDEYQDVFPEVRLDPASKAASRFAIAKFRGKYLGRGVGQGISGFRANIAAVDDPFAALEDAESPTTRRKVFDWFQADLSTRLLPNSPLFVVATRWHTEDLCGRLEELAKKGVGLPYEVINLPALAEEDDDILGRMTGDPLWPDFYTLDHLLNLKAALPARVWNALYQGSPMDVAGGTFQADWVQRYENYPTNEIDDLGRIKQRSVRRVVVSVDCASKAGERNDYTAITVWVESVERKHYLVDVVRERLEFEPMVKAIEDTTAKWNTRIPGVTVAAILVEDKGSGTQYIQTRRGKAPAPVIAIEVAQTSKEFRFDGVTPMFEAGEVFFPESALWLPDYEKELLGFPNASKDDQVDSTSQYLAWARRRGSKGTKKLTGANSTSTSARAPSTGRGGMIGSRARAGEWRSTVQSTPSAKIGG
jgi:predicted phage terminase large subunit-like protein